MPTIHLFSYPDTATEPVDFKNLVNDYSDAGDTPSDEQIKKLNDLRARMASLFVSQPNTKAILNVSFPYWKYRLYFFKVIEEYIPELVGILPYIEHNKLQNLMSKYKINDF